MSFAILGNEFQRSGNEFRHSGNEFRHFLGNEFRPKRTKKACYVYAPLALPFLITDAVVKFPNCRHSELKLN